MKIPVNFSEKFTSSVEERQAAFAEAVRLATEQDEFFEVCIERECLKRFSEAQELFWRLFSERRAEHRAKIRREANRACNLWRCHREELAARCARHVPVINLFLSARGQPHGFRRARRLDLEGVVALCRQAGHHERQIADALFHLLFENSQAREVGGLLPRCGCQE